MSKSKKVIFISKHAGFSISRNTRLEMQTINGVPTNVRVTPPPFRFANFRLEVDANDTETLAELRGHRLYKSYFEELAEKPLPKAVKEVVSGGESDAQEEGESAESDEAEAPDEEPALVNEELETLQQTKDWLVAEHGADIEDLNTPDKIKEALRATGVELPNAKFKY